MARNRMIKLEFWESRTLASVSRDSRLLFIGLWNFSDDYGVMLGSPRRILGDIFPYDEDVKIKDVEKWIEELEGVGAIIEVLYKGGKYYVIPSWKMHQKVDRPSKRMFIPEDEIETLVQSSRESRESLVDKREREIEIETEREREREIEPLFPKMTQENFEAFWKAYPKKREKRLARERFMKIKFKEFEEIISAVKQAANSENWIKESGTYIPYPAKWLKNESWKDEGVVPLFQPEVNLSDINL